ncbi:condensation domain-containing protein, partial [Streptomyces sp. SID7909]|uniref:condensation domain-containing protein n=1 Tax=Streptomyces sp. SID7909 TaxID=2706092 RepID=UPI0013BC0B14
MRENGSVSPESAPESAPEEFFGTTAAQQGVWYGQLVDPDSPKYNVGECFEIRGDLDEALFAAAVDRACELCDSLNLEFVTEGDTLLQRVVREPGARRLRIVDVSGAADPAAEVERYLATDMATPDTLHRPRHHMALLRAGTGLSYWYVRFHHIAVDGLGGAVFTRVVADLYGRAVKGEDLAEVTLPAAPLRDLVADETAHRESGRHDADRAYWTAKFADRAPEDTENDDGHRGRTLIRRRTDLPAPAGDAPAAPGASGLRLHNGESLSAEVFEDLRRLAAAHRTTWSAVLVAAVAAYTARVTGTREVTVGLASNGRHGGLRHIVGMTSNILPLRLTPTGTMSVGELVREAAAEMRGALRHRRFSREQLARELNTGDDPSRLTGIVVNIMGYDYDRDFAGIPAPSRVLSVGPVDDLSLFVSERAEGKGPLIGFDARPDLYHPEDVRLHEQAVVSFVSALAAADPALPLRDLPLVDESAAPALRAQGLGTDLPERAVARTLPEAFRDQARRTPDAPAVVDGTHTLSYRQLDRAADDLASALTGWGVGAEDGVGVLLGRSAAVPAATL